MVLISQAPGRFEDNAVLLEAAKCETESDQIRAVGGDRRARGRKCHRRILIDDNYAKKYNMSKNSLHESDSESTEVLVPGCFSFTTHNCRRGARVVRSTALYVVLTSRRRGARRGGWSAAARRQAAPTARI